MEMQSASIATSPSPARRNASVAPPPSPEPRGLLDRIFERKRAALVDLNGSAEAPPRRRLRVDDPAERPEDKVAVQRFTLVSRGAPPAKRAAAQHDVLITPPRAAAQLGLEVHVCRCSDCDRHGVRRRMSGRRVCRRDTESHPEYALLLNMTDRFEAECPSRQVEGAALVNEACCREKTAYFILGPGSTTVGYVAAEVAANRRVRRVQESISIMSDAGSVFADDEDDKVPKVVQIYVEPEFRNKGYASEALGLLLRDHNMVNVDDPTPVVVHAIEKLGLARAETKEGSEGRPLVTFARECQEC